MKTAGEKKKEKGYNTISTHLFKENVIIKVVSQGLVQIISISEIRENELHFS